MKKISIFLAPLAAFLAIPLLAAAQAPGQINTAVLMNYKGGILTIINNIFVPILFAVSFLHFVFGVYKYFIAGAAEEEQRTKGKQFVLWSIIGFAVIVSVWGLVGILTTTIGVTNTPIVPPTL